MATTSCQTDDDKKLSTKRKILRKESSSSFSTFYNNSALLDDESILSTAYYDLKFDYTTDISNSAIQKSTLSILKADDEEPVLLSKLGSGPNSNFLRKSQPSLRIQNSLTVVQEHPRSVDFEKMTRSCLSCSNIAMESLPSQNVSLERLRNMCGLLPVDFDTCSISSRSTLVDSGYDKSHFEDSKDLQKVATGPNYERKVVDDMDKQTEKEFKSLVE